MRRPDVARRNRVCGTSLPDAVTLRTLAIHLTSATDSSSLFTGTLFRRLFVMTAQLHFAIYTFALQLLLKGAQRLIDIVIANDDLHEAFNLQSNNNRTAGTY